MTKIIPYNNVPPKILHRYTNIRALNELLNYGIIKFSNRRKWNAWPDQNDKALLELYRQHSNKEIFVYCMTHKSETIHHWQSYTSKEGCRIKFNVSKLLPYLKKYEITGKAISYVKQQDLGKFNPKHTLEDFPFLKRNPYSVESEFRLIKILQKGNNSFELEVSPDVIEEISLSPFNTEEENEKLKNSLLKKHPHLKGKFSNSKITKYDNWINYFEKIAIK